jgi:hypothetical protein
MTVEADSGVEWRAWPLRRSPGRGALAAIIVVGSVVGVWSWSGSAALTALAVVVLGISVGPFFLPTGYRLDPQGVEVRLPWRRRRRAWSDFRTVHAGGELVVLSPFLRRTWLETLRGETLRTEGNRGEVHDYAKRMVESAAGEDVV